MTDTKKKKKAIPPETILVNDLYSLLELRAMQSKQISDYLSTTYGSLSGFMEYLFEEGLLHPLEAPEAVEAYCNSKYVSAEINEDRSEAYIIIADENFNSFRLFICSRDTLNDTEACVFTISDSFKCKWTETGSEI